MKKALVAILTAGALVSSASAKVSFSLDIEALSNGSGSSLTNSGLLVLVVDTDDDGFSGPSDSSLTGSDELVAMWDLSAVGTGNADITLLTEGGVAYGSDWAPGDSLGLIWFPGLSASNTDPAADEEFGFFTDSLGLVSGDDWMMPADGTFLHSLKLFTESATKLVMQGNGEIPDAFGMASFAVNNVPSSGSSKPTSIAATPDKNAMNVTWSGGSATGGGYVIYRKSSDSSTWEYVGYVSDGESSFKDSKGIKPGLTYDYQVLAANGFTAALSDESGPTAAERSVFKAIAARGSIVENPAFNDWGLINAGVILSGNDPNKKVLVLGLGPHYNAEEGGTTNWISDPTLSYNVLGDPTPIASSDNWMQDPEDPSQLDPDASAALDTMVAVGTPVLAVDDPGSSFVSLDSAILEDVPINTANLFKVRSTGTGGFVGIQLYDAEYLGTGGPVINDNRITSISSRGYLSAGGVFNGSVVIEGNVPKEVLAVALGPQLINTGTNADAVLEDPLLSLRALGKGEITTNDDWETQTAASDPSKGLVSVETDMARLAQVMESQGYNLSQLGKDSAMLVTLEPGNYNFRILAANGSKQDGSTIIEVREIEVQ